MESEGGTSSVVDSCNTITQNMRWNRKGQASSIDQTEACKCRLVRGDQLRREPVLSKIFIVLGQ